MNIRGPRFIEQVCKFVVKDSSLQLPNCSNGRCDDNNKCGGDAYFVHRPKLGFLSVLKEIFIQYVWKVSFLSRP